MENNIVSTEDLQMIRTLRAMGIEVDLSEARDIPAFFDLTDEELAREVIYTPETELEKFLSIHDAAMDRTETPAEDAAFGLILERVAREELEALESHEERLMWVMEYSGPGQPGWESFLDLRTEALVEGGDYMSLGLDDDEEEDVYEVEEEFFEEFPLIPWRHQLP